MKNENCYTKQTNVSYVRKTVVQNKEANIVRYYSKLLRNKEYCYTKFIMQKEHFYTENIKRLYNNQAIIQEENNCYITYI